MLAAHVHACLEQAYRQCCRERQAREVDCCVLVIVSVVFFSSRRRHTRLQGDCSSDVCSSDLGLWEKFESMFRNFGWDVVIVKYGRLMQAAFAEPGGEALKRWIDACPNQMYAALCFQGGAAFRKHLRDEIGDQGAVSQLIDRRSDDELLDLMSNLGGHDMASMIEAFEAIDHDRPVCFIAYTIKGIGLPFQGHKDNHAGLMTVTQMEKWRAAQNIRPGHEWEKFEGLSQEPAALEAFLADAPFNRDGRRRLTADVIDVPEQLSFKPSPQMS